MFRPRGKHPVLVAFSCRVYALMIWCYPASLRREYRREMLLTFKNMVEDALDSHSASAVFLFVMHTAADWFRTLTLEPEQPVTLSLLGLGSSDGAGAGCIDSSSVSVSLMLATLGVILLIAGWWEWLKLSATIMSHHRIV
jgi:hypothetical protein